MKNAFYVHTYPKFKTIKCVIFLQKKNRLGLMVTGHSPPGHPPPGQSPPGLAD